MLYQSQKPTLKHSFVFSFNSEELTHLALFTQALAKEESYEEIIRDLTQRLKDAESRAMEGNSAHVHRYKIADIDMAEIYV